MSAKERGSEGSFIYACSMRQKTERSRTILRRISASVGPGRLVRALLAPGVVGDTVPRGDRWVPWLKPPIILFQPRSTRTHASQVVQLDIRKSASARPL
jgi:hypothetical protein